MKHMRLREIAEEGKDRTKNKTNQTAKANGTLNGSPDFSASEVIHRSKFY